VVALPWYEVQQAGHVLGVGPGDGDRLLAPGVPDTLLADGERLGWLARGALVLLGTDRSEARLLALADEVSATATGPERWVLVEEGALVVIDPLRGVIGRFATDLVEDLSRVLPGVDLAVLRTAGGSRGLDISDGAELDLPVGARDSRLLVPWSRGRGLVWIDDDILYRWTPERGASVGGNLPGRVVALVPGPLGSAVVTLGDGSCLVTAPGRQVVRLEEEVLAPSVRFDTEGQRLIATTAHGTAVFATATGAVVRRWTGAAQPVGFAPDPLRWDEDRGAVLGAEDEVVLSGFGLCGVSQDLPLLVGPGGAVWDLTEGCASWSHPALAGGLTLVDDDRVLHLGDRDATLFDDRGAVLGGWRIPLFSEAAAEDTLAAVRTGGGHLSEDADALAEAAWLDGRVVLLTLDGEVGVAALTTGDLHERRSLEVYEETDGWPGLLPHRRRGVWLRDGEGATLLPGGAILAAPDWQVEALLPVGRAVARSGGGRLELIEPDGRVTWREDLDAWSLALGRHLFAAVDEDLVLLDPLDGTVRARHEGALSGLTGLTATADGHLWAYGAIDGDLRLVCFDGATGAQRRSWELPVDGVVFAGGGLWAWTEEGSLVRIAR